MSDQMYHRCVRGKEAAYEAAGGPAYLARMIGLSKQAVWSWDIVPAERVPDVERATSIPRARLRPDLFG